MVLYLVADAAAAAGPLEPLGWAVGLCAVGLSGTLLVVRKRAGEPGSRRVGLLGFFAALGLLRLLDPAALRLSIDAAQVVGLCGFGMLLLDLALSVPDPIARAGSLRALRLSGSGLGVLAAILGLLSHAPALHRAGRSLVVPASAALVPGAYAAGCMLIALVLRLMRRRLGSGPEALASNGWAVLGLIPATGVAATLVLARLVGFAWPTTYARLAPALALLGVALCHLLLVDPAQRLRVGPTTRNAVAAGLTLLAVCVSATLAYPWLPDSNVGFGALVAATLLLSLALYRGLRPAVQLLVAPSAGRLLEALEQARQQVPRARGLEELASAALAPLRAASGSAAAEPLLYLFDPARHVQLDAAGRAHVGVGPLHPVIEQRLRSAPSDILLRGPLQAQMVRQPILRPLIEAVVALDALCIVPLTLDGELEGALVVPQGRRRSALTLEELDALRGFGFLVSSIVSVLSRDARAQTRAHEAVLQLRQVEQSVETLTAEAARLREDARILRAGRVAARMSRQPIAYSESMRALLERIDRLASSDAPALLVCESGTPVDLLAHRIHVESGRAARPFVVVDCSLLPADGSAAALFGTGEGDRSQPGYLQLAGDGTLLLLDVPALSGSTQRALAQAIATGEVTAAGARTPYVTATRIVGTARVAVAQLVEAGSLDKTLAQRFAPLTLEVPPLRERPEDLPSLVLLALDHASRVLGRSAVGIEDAAMQRLADYPWPGNQRELQVVIDHAVARCEGPRVRPADLPELLCRRPEPSQEQLVLAGTLEDVESRVLQQALVRAGGNKSEAARSLGLKRTTFLDKLRRHGLDEPARARVGAPN